MEEVGAGLSLMKWRSGIGLDTVRARSPDGYGEYLEIDHYSADRAAPYSAG